MRLISFLLSLVLLGTPALAQTVPWATVVAQAQNGGVIDLGDQEVTFQRGKFTPKAPVTIKGGHFQSVILDGWSNVTFDGSTFEKTDGGAGYSVIVLVYGGENVTFRNVKLRGTVLDDGNLAVTAMRFMGGKNMTVDRSTFTDMLGAILFLRTDGATFTDNNMSNIREGLNLVGATNVVVARNRFGPFHPGPLDHPDAVQFFTAGLTLPTDTAARNVLLEDNLTISGPDGRAQCYFSGDEGNLSPSRRGYANITLRGNICLGGGWHGIFFRGDIPNLLIEGNKMYRVAGDDAVKDVWIWAESGIVRNNQSSRFTLTPNVTQSGNVTNSDAVTPEQYAKIIADWDAKFRAPPAPPKPMYTPLQLKVMEMEDNLRDLRELVGLPR